MKRIVISHMYRNGSIIQRIKNLIWWSIVRRLSKAPEKFFYFPSKGKTDYRICGYHWSGQIRIFRKDGESIKAWNAFCFKLVYNSRQNKKQAGYC